MILAVKRERYYKRKKTEQRRSELTKGQMNLLTVIFVMKLTILVLALIAIGALFTTTCLKAMTHMRLIGFFSMMTIISLALVTGYLDYRLKKQLGYDIYEDDTNSGHR
jgi:carbon starvation protein CstA